MKITAAKCPSCGADIQVDSDSNQTKCDFCGSNVIVEEAIENHKIEISGEVTVSNSPKIESLLMNADRSYKNKDYTDALDKYDKVLDMAADNPKAIYGKAACKILLENVECPNISVLKNGISDAISLLNNSEEIDNMISDAISIMNTLFYSTLANCNVSLTSFSSESAINGNEYIVKLYEIVFSMNELFDKVSNNALKKYIAESIVKNCNNALTLFYYKLNGSRKKLESNNYVSQYKLLKNKYIPVTGPIEYDPVIKEEKLKFNLKDLLKKDIGYKPLIIIVIAVLFILLFVLITNAINYIY